MLRLLTMLVLVGCLAGIGGGRLLAQTLKGDKDHGRAGGQVGLAIAKADQLSIGAAGLAPGDQTQRTFDLKNVGKAKLATVSLTTTASPSSALDSDSVNGLQLRIDKCRKPWELEKKSRRYTCKKPQSVVRSRPVIGSNIRLGNMDELHRPGQSVHLLLTLTLPQTAPPALANLKSSLSYSFTGA